jgi:hypothetical protein
MKKILPYLFSAILFLQGSRTFSQTSVTSTDGYTVNISVIPKAIVPGSGSCEFGYNYNVQLQFSVSYTGINQPASLYTMQGTLGCGSDIHFFDLPNGQNSGTVTSQSNVWRGTSDCATSNVVTLGCNQVTIEIEGPGISHQFVTFAVTPIPLPVKLTDFSAAVVNNRVKLNWSTATEINSNYFIVEKKATGAAGWQAVAKLNAKGQSTDITNYTAFDDNPQSGTTEYRLAMVDVDGKTDYSAVQLITYHGKTGAISIYPVPAKDRIIHFAGLRGSFADYSYSVLDMAGTVLATKTLSGSSAELPSLKAGMYIIRVVNKTTGESVNLRYIQ